MSPAATAVKSVKIITDSDLCVSCGVCAYACPYENVEILYNDDRGKWEPGIGDHQICADCEGEKYCLAVCPSYAVDYVSLAGSDQNQLRGRIEEVHHGYAHDGGMRFNSSSGGLIKTLCRSLLEAGEVDGVIAITHDGGMDYTPKIVTSVQEMPNSIYHNINFENAIPLLRDNEGRYLLVATPCQLTAIAQLLRSEPFAHLEERVYAKVAIFCGYSFDRVVVEAFGKYNDFDVKSITYRERGRYRKHRISDGERSRVFDVYNSKTLIEEVHNRLTFDKFLPSAGCLYCVDHAGYCADIVAGDAWLQRFKDDNVGTSIVLARTPWGSEVLRKVEGFHLEPGRVEDVEGSQGETYGLGSIGEAMKRIRFGGGHVPGHLRTRNPDDVKVYRFSFGDHIVLKVVRRLILRRRFRAARAVYMLTIPQVYARRALHFVRRLRSRWSRSGA